MFGCDLMLLVRNFGHLVALFIASSLVAPVQVISIDFVRSV